ncbi:phosphopeptide-binding protein [Mycobacterium sp. EPG1]|nr:phosphopeptide-binding protein [Mycobacterium sp. EPG1]
MKFTSALATATTAAAAALALGGAPLASADSEVQWLGQPGELVNGGVVQHWTVSHLKPSPDTIPYTPAGTLWEATASDEAVSGDVTPIISNLNARAKNGDTYRVLFGVATEQGVNPATLPQGQKTSGKIYFDVTGEAPDSVFYSSGVEEELLWVQPPPAPPSGTGGSGSTTASPSSTGGASEAPAAAAESPQAAPASEAPAAVQATPSQVPASSGAPLPEGSSGTPLPEGSSGTPLPEGSSGTPLPEGSSGTPLPQDAVPHGPGAPTTTVAVPAPPA